MSEMVGEEPLLVAQGLTKWYGRLGCRDVSFELYEGEVMAVVGESSRCCSHIQQRGGQPIRWKPGSKSSHRSDPYRGASNLAGRSKCVNQEAPKDVPKLTQSG
jgi:hypothetical protein